MSLDPVLGSRFQAVAVGPVQLSSRLSLDPRLARRFLRSTSLLSFPEVRQRLTQYIATSKWRPNERVVYGAVLEGHTTVAEISGVTGLTEGQVSTSVSKLQSKGMLKEVTA